jgi:hypothetical protein
VSSRAMTNAAIQSYGGDQRERQLPSHRHRRCLFAAISWMRPRDLRRRSASADLFERTWRRAYPGKPKPRRLSSSWRLAARRNLCRGDFI